MPPMNGTKRHRATSVERLKRDHQLSRLGRKLKKMRKACQSVADLRKGMVIARKKAPTCYVLSVSVLPGGAREHCHAMLNTWDEVTETLVEALSSTMDAYLTAWYGRKFELRVYQKGVVVGTYNPKDWIAFDVIDGVRDAKFGPEDYGALTCRDQLEGAFNRKLWDSEEKPKVEGTTITHSLYTIRVQVPNPPPEHSFLGDATQGTTIRLPLGKIYFPSTLWE